MPAAAPVKMTAAEVLARMEELGTAQNRKVYSRHDDQVTFGVSFANLYALRKSIKRDHELALDLWADGRFEPQTLACMIADPARFGADDLDRWAAEAGGYAVADSVAKEIALQTPHALDRAGAWIDSDVLNMQRAGWTVLALLAGKPDSGLDLEPYLARIERQIHTAPNRVKEGMNNALIAFGGSSEQAADVVIPVAERIGEVKVDHGQTNCKTPLAVPYIRKMLARQASRAATRKS